MRSAVEWLCALGVLVGAVWLGGPIVQRLAPPVPTTVTMVESNLPALPGGVPSNAQSVPFVVMLDGAVIRRGMSEDELAHRARSMAGPPRFERGILDDRIVQPYRSGNSEFWVVLDRTALGEPRQVTAVYLRTK